MPCLGPTLLGYWSGRPLEVWGLGGCCQSRFATYSIPTSESVGGRSFTQHSMVKPDTDSREGLGADRNGQEREIRRRRSSARSRWAVPGSGRQLESQAPLDFPSHGQTERQTYKRTVQIMLIELVGRARAYSSIYVRCLLLRGATSTQHRKEKSRYLGLALSRTYLRCETSRRIAAGMRGGRPICGVPRPRDPSATNVSELGHPRVGRQNKEKKRRGK